MTTIEKVEMLAERYILLDSLFFKIMTAPDRDSIVSDTRNM